MERMGRKGRRWLGAGTGGGNLGTSVGETRNTRGWWLERGGAEKTESRLNPYQSGALLATPQPCVGPEGQETLPREAGLVR